MYQQISLQPHNNNNNNHNDFSSDESSHDSHSISSISSMLDTQELHSEKSNTRQNIHSQSKYKVTILQNTKVNLPKTTEINDDSIIVQESTDDDDDDNKDITTWNYAYSYASSTIARSRYGDNKTIDSLSNIFMIKRPSLINEIEPFKSIYTEEIKIPSIYDGIVSLTPIEIHNDLQCQAKLKGPVLMYRRRHFKNKTKNELGYNPIFALPIQSIIINIEISLNIAFIKMKIIFINNCNQTINNSLFALPINGNGIVTNISVCIDNKNNNNNNNDNKRYIETLLIDSDDLHKNNNYDFSSSSSSIFNIPFNEYIDNLFRLPINLISIDCDDLIIINIKYQQEFEYFKGRYHLEIPLQFKSEILPNNVNLNEIIHINIILNSFLSSNIKFGSNSHNLIINKKENKQIYFSALSMEHDIKSKNFHMAYYIETNKISGNAFIEYKDKAIDGDIGNFILYINPPSTMNNNNNDGIFSRDIIFLIDRSKSMIIGSSHSKVIKGLSNSLDMLSYKNNGDKFGIICYNETQIYFNGFGNINNKNDIKPPNYPLFEATKYYINNAKQFIVNYGPLGGTDIGTPLKWSLKKLNNIYNKKRIQFIVLITDGCDYQEKQILNDIDKYCKNIRILTFGIGKYCNPYFLKQLSLKSRGWNDIAYYSNDIKSKLYQLIEKCYAPILKDLNIQHCINNNNNNNDIKIYPKQINDIYLSGKPIIIYGEYKNNKLQEILLKTNNKITISGININGKLKIYQFKINYYSNLKLLFLKQKLDELTLKYWIFGNNIKMNLKKEIINLSIKENFPSQYTSMICFKCTKIEKYNLNQQKILSINNTLSINSKIINIGITNKLFGDANINDNISGIYQSIGQFINDDDDDDDDNNNDNNDNVYNKNNCCLCCCCCCCYYCYNSLKRLFMSL